MLPSGAQCEWGQFEKRVDAVLGVRLIATVGVAFCGTFVQRADAPTHLEVMPSIAVDYAREF